MSKYVHKYFVFLYSYKTNSDLLFGYRLWLGGEKFFFSSQLVFAVNLSCMQREPSTDFNELRFRQRSMEGAMQL